MTARSAIAEAFRAALRLNGPAWLPGLGSAPADAAWSSLAVIGIVPASYGTERVRNGDPAAARSVVREIATPIPFMRDRPILIESLSPAIAARYEDLGLDLAPPAVSGSVQVAARWRRRWRGSRR